MRSAHEHEQDGVRFTCVDSECRKPFKLPNTPPKHTRRHPTHIRERVASREEQQARYLDCGPQNWDDRD